jgi:hypothetical protein
MLVNESRNVVADIEDEPDGNKTRDAVKIHLQEIANNVAIKKSHYDLDGPVPVSVLKSMARAKSRAKKNDEI